MSLPSCLEELTEPGSPTARLTQEANEAFTHGNIARVCECLAAVLELSPRNGELALALGHAEMSEGHLEAALAAYGKAASLMPNVASAHSGRALAARLLGRNADASRSAIRAISLDPCDPVGLKVLARIHIDSGQPEAARQACGLVLRQNAHDADAGQMMEEVLVQEAKLAENLMDRKIAPPLGRL